MFPLLFIILMSCANQTNDKAQAKVENAQSTNDTSAYVWTKLLDSAEWKKSYNFQMFSINDTLWTFHPDGN